MFYNIILSTSIWENKITVSYKKVGRGGEGFQRCSNPYPKKVGGPTPRTPSPFVMPKIYTTLGVTECLNNMSDWYLIHVKRIRVEDWEMEFEMVAMQNI